MTPAQLRTRMIGTLVPTSFASNGLFDCPLCGGKGELYLTICCDNKKVINAQIGGPLSGADRKTFARSELYCF
jgi:hypothetical protein